MSSLVGCLFLPLIVKIYSFKKLNKAFWILAVLCIFLDDSSLSCMCFYQNFSLCPFFMILAGSFPEYNFLIFMKYNLSVHSFMDCALGVPAKKSPLYTRSSKCHLLSYSRSFTALHFTCIAVIRFELIL